MKIIVLFLLVLFMGSGCDLESDCPVNCDTVVRSPNGEVIECHCPR